MNALKRQQEGLGSAREDWVGYALSIVYTAQQPIAQPPALQLAICVPLVILVISKTVRKNEYTTSKTIIWAQSRICVEIQDLDLQIFEIISKIQDLDLHTLEIISKIQDFDLHTFESISDTQDLDFHIFEIISKVWDLEVRIFDFWNNL